MLADRSRLIRLVLIAATATAAVAWPTHVKSAYAGDDDDDDDGGDSADDGGGDKGGDDSGDEEEADEETLAEMGIETAWELSGLYRGTPLGARSVSDVARTPDLITLYRMPILLEWIEEGEDLYRLVRNVLVHEVAHHFGFSDADIEALEQEIDEAG